MTGRLAVAALALSLLLAGEAGAARPTTTRPPARPATPATAPQEDAETADARASVAAVRRSPTLPHAVLGAAELGHLLPWVEPAWLRAQVQSASQRLRANPRGDAPRAAVILGAVLEDLGGAEPAATPASWGFVDPIFVLGPFGAEHGTALDQTLGPEVAPEARFDPDAPFEGRDGAVRWRSVARGKDVGQRMVVDLAPLVERPDDAVLFVRSWIRVSSLPRDPTPVVLNVAHDGGLVVHFNGAEVLRRPNPELPTDVAFGMSPLVDRSCVAVFARPGWNAILVKLSPAGSRIPFGLRVTGADFKPIPIDVATDPSREPDTGGVDHRSFVLGPASTRQGKAIMRRLAALGRTAPAQPGATSPTDADQDRAEHPELGDESPDAALDSAALLRSAGARVGYLHRALKRHPGHLGLSLRLGRLLLDRGDPVRARAVLEAARRDPPSASREVLLARTYTTLGMTQRGRTILQAADKAMPNRPALVEALGADAVGRTDVEASERYARRLAQLRPAWDSAPLHLAEVLAGRGDVDGALAVLAQVRDRRPERVDVPLNALRLLLEYDRTHPATLAPWLGPIASLPRADVYEMLGRLRERAGDNDGALALFQKALGLAPQRTVLRVRLRRLAKDLEVEAPHRRDLTALARAASREAFDAARPPEILLSQTIVRSLPNGRTARYEAQVLRVGKGSPNEQVLQASFVPSRQEASIVDAWVLRRDGTIDRGVERSSAPLGEDWYGLYYDLEAARVRFRRLEAGDVVVFTSRVSDLVPNPLGLVFAELLVLGERNKVRETEIVIEAPATKPLRWALVDPRDTKRKISEVQDETVGGLRRLRVRARDLPALEAEPDMPGATDVLPYLHVSTFKSWEEVGAWYAAIVAPQAAPSADVARLAAGLAKRDATLEHKVRALHEYVAQRVRYVGLEFGIHSIKPYSPSQVIARRFGDCKDKATLLVALARELGVDARLVLVRTAPNGRLHDDVASLAVFDHAIAWVPGLDLFLDETATYHGIHELPSQDRGAEAFIIALDPKHAPRRVRIPEDGPERHRRAEHLVMHLEADGGARIEGEVHFVGIQAARVRARFQAADKRKEVLEEELGLRFPGIEIAEVEMKGIDPIEDEVVARYKALARDIAQRDGDGFRVSPVRSSSSLASRLAKLGSRRFPLVFGNAWRETLSVRVEPPPGFRFQPMAKVDLRKDGDGRFEFKVASEGSALRFELLFEFGAREVPADRYAAFRRWLEAIDAALRTAPRIDPIPRAGGSS